MTDRHTSFWDKERSVLFLPRSRSDEGTHPSHVMLTNELILFFVQQSQLKKQCFWSERTRKGSFFAGIAWDQRTKFRKLQMPLANQKNIEQ